MFRVKTVFVIGAGASNEVGLPVGSELKTIIAGKLDFKFDDFGNQLQQGDQAIWRVFLNRHGNNVNEIFDICRQISDGIVLSPSIDDFIHVHQHDVNIAECSKLAIAKSILEEERKSKLFFEKTNIYNTINFKSVENTWYTKFYQLLSHQVPKGTLQDLFENVTVVSFNYDRCIEHFLVHAIARHYSITINDAHDLVGELSIFHPYGFVGPYFGPLNRIVEFGFRGLPEFDKVMSSVKTYTEQIEDDNTLIAMRKAVAEAEIIVFLGTAFHSNNMALLTGGTKTLSEKTIYATRYGISDADLPAVNGALSRLCGADTPRLEHHRNYHFSMKCQQLFDEYRMSLRN